MVISDFITNTVLPWVFTLLQSNPVIAPIFLALFVVQGFCRFFFKPLVVAISAYVQWTPEPGDNAIWDKVLANKWYKLLAFMVDWLASIKLPGRK